MSRRNESALSERERLILTLAADGLTDKEIAHRLDIGVATVRTYWDRTRRKLGTINRAQSVARLTADEEREADRDLMGEAHQRLIEVNVLPIVVGVLEGPLMEANEAFEALSGYTRQEIWTQTIATGQVFVDRPRSEWLDVRFSGTSKPFVQQLRHRNGTRIPVLMRVAALAQQPGLFAAYVIDLSELQPFADSQAPMRLLTDHRYLLR